MRDDAVLDGGNVEGEITVPHQCAGEYLAFVFLNRTTGGEEEERRRLLAHARAACGGDGDGFLNLGFDGVKFVGPFAAIVFEPDSVRRTQGGGGGFNVLQNDRAGLAVHDLHPLLDGRVGGEGFFADTHGQRVRGVLESLGDDRAVGFDGGNRRTCGFQVRCLGAVGVSHSDDRHVREHSRRPGRHR
jgi:hypothetical protein